MDIYYHAQKLCAVFNLQFKFPTREKRPTPDLASEKYMRLDLPDVLLAASVVLATTYAYPPDNIERYPRSQRDPLTLKMDWAAWQAEFPMTTERQRERIDFQNMDPESVWSMSQEEITEYLDWFQETQLNPQGRGGKFHHRTSTERAWLTSSRNRHRATIPPRRKNRSASSGGYD